MIFIGLFLLIFFIKSRLVTLFSAFEVFLEELSLGLTAFIFLGIFKMEAIFFK